MSADLTWNEEVWCVTCGSTDRTRQYHRGHVISRRDMRYYLPVLNHPGYIKYNLNRMFRDDEPWNIVSQCRECNNATHANLASINHPSCEREALWRALNLHSNIKTHLHLAMSYLAGSELAEAVAKRLGKRRTKAHRRAEVTKSVETMVYVIHLMHHAMDLTALRLWLGHLREAESQDRPTHERSEAEEACERETQALIDAWKAAQ